MIITNDDYEHFITLHYVDDFDAFYDVNCDYKSVLCSCDAWLT